MTDVNDDLLKLWNLLEEKLNTLPPTLQKNLPEIKKLMTANSVIDISTHGIYGHTKYIQNLSLHLATLRANHHEDKEVSGICTLWIRLLKARIYTPLIIKHHQQLEGRCSFDFSLQIMEDKEYGLKQISQLDVNNADEFKAAIEAIKYLGYLSHGMSFADLPIVKDEVLNALLKYKDSLCFIAKDVNERIVGTLWGFMLRDVPVGTEKVNVFWWFSVARHPDFYDPNVKVGTLLRNYMVTELAQHADCHFIGYRHILNNKFHTDIIEGGLAQEEEKINFANKLYAAKSLLIARPPFNTRLQLVRLGAHVSPFPEMNALDNAIMTTIRRAAPSLSAFFLGGALIFGRAFFSAKPLLDKPLEERIEDPVSTMQQNLDLQILKNLLLSREWNACKGKIPFFSTEDPLKKFNEKLKRLFDYEQNDFLCIRQYIKQHGESLLNNKLTLTAHSAIIHSSTATGALNLLLENKETPIPWLDLIAKERLQGEQQNLRASYS